MKKRVDIQFNASEYNNEWYTPIEIIDQLGGVDSFDLDPCAPVVPLYRTAKQMYNKHQDGLKQQWNGRVWLNPPYSRPEIELFMRRMVSHGNGIALLFNRCDSKMFQDLIFPNMSGILFLRNRIKFLRPDGTTAGSPAQGSVLIAFGDKNAEILKGCGIKGCFLKMIK